MNIDVLYQRAGVVLQRLDEVYQSPSVQELKNYAPLIIQSCKELSAIEKGFRHKIDLMRESRAERLEKFHEIAPGMMQNLKSVLDQILQLQQEVRVLSGRIGKDPSAKTIIDYTERHIQQLLYLFQKLSFNLLNA